MRALVVRVGQDCELPRDRETGLSTHQMGNVYREMILQICSDYPGLPDVRTLTMTEIRFFYDGMRSELKRLTGKKK